MGSLPKSDQAHVPKDDDLDKAQRLANTITLNRFTSKLKENPSADIADLLRQQVISYPKLRESLTRLARQKTASSNSNKSKSDDNNGGPQTSDTANHELLVSSDYNITHPFGELMSSGADVASPDAEHELVSSLNRAINAGQVLWKLHDTFVVGLSPSTVVKIGSSLDNDEITNLQYVNTHAPSVPSPTFSGSLLSTSQKSSIQKQPNKIFSDLRSDVLGPRRTEEGTRKIGSFKSATCKDLRRLERVCKRQVHSEAEFDDFLCFDSRKSVTAWTRIIRKLMKENHRIVMTHGDLHPRNIMVKYEMDKEEALGEGEEKRVRVAGIIDWALSGWYPEYWEHVKALSTIDTRGSLADWYEYLPTEAIGEWPVEFSVDLLISRWLG
ncbi:hypothetical protein F4781DRAFT_441777 [Annulohypoxylon bovei var. microspora]|nr:hypothetical protein F4781DRAFT_441777 [Annulohypoxylon bovei var. microspora]